MFPLYIAPESCTPLVDFDPKTGLLLIAGSSHSEHANLFYGPIMAWVKCYGQELQSVAPLDGWDRKNSILRLHFLHVNSMSFRAIMRICKLFVEVYEPNDRKIEWMYDKGDTDMKDSGQILKNVLSPNVDFKILAAETLVENFLLHLDPPRSDGRKDR